MRGTSPDQLASTVGGGNRAAAHSRRAQLGAKPASHLAQLLAGLEPTGRSSTIAQLAGWNLD